jgi:hypothetical protein
MRSGRLLAENSPENLLRDYNLTSLENVFLELCMKNHENKLTSIVTNSTSCNKVDYKTEQTHHSQEGVDDMVFDESVSSQLNVSETEIAIDPQIHNNNCDAVSSRPIEFCSVRNSDFFFLFLLIPSFLKLTQFEISHLERTTVQSCHLCHD